MRTIRMIVAIQGGRYDGQSWPGFNGLITVPDWEADELVDNRNAEEVDEPELARGWDVLKEPDLDYERKLKGADNDHEDHDEEPTAFSSTDLGDEDDDFDRDDSDDEPEPVTPPVKRPTDYASKSDWVDYAVASGADRSLITQMTKAWIIEAYGN